MTDRNDASSVKSREQKSAWPLVIGLPLIVIVAAAAIFFSSTGENTEQADDGSSGSATPGEQASGAEQSSADDLGHPSLGDEGAPVVMLEFSDYQ
ncbi:MAG: hypothetical protein ACRDSJ_12730 [Rubrobacteraceae bacterium]